MFRILLLSTLLFLGACSSPVAVDNDPPLAVAESTDTTPVTCVYKYDSRYNITFLAKDKVEYHPPSLPTLLVYHITDTTGKHWAVNQYDWPNYTCTP
jgi:hypothetical protein